MLSLLALNVPHAVDDARDDLQAIMKKGGQYGVINRFL